MKAGLLIVATPLVAAPLRADDYSVKARQGAILVSAATAAHLAVAIRLADARCRR